MVFGDYIMVFHDHIDEFGVHIMVCTANVIYNNRYMFHTLLVYIVNSYLVYKYNNIAFASYSCRICLILSINIDYW
jgi:hypothetical protein